MNITTKKHLERIKKLDLDKKIDAIDKNNLKEILLKISQSITIKKDYFEIVKMIDTL